MNIPIFLSYPKPFLSCQQRFVDQLVSYLASRKIEAVTLGITDYDMTSPLTTIRRMVYSSSGMITIAFRRAHIIRGISNPGSDVGRVSSDLSGQWTTGAYCHIESAMAYQVGLPLLILRESGVIADGILEPSATGVYMPEFDLSAGSRNFFETEEYRQLTYKWESRVRTVYDSRGNPPALY